MFEKLKQLISAGKIKKEVLAVFIFVVLALIVTIIYFLCNGQNEIILEKNNSAQMNVTTSAAVKKEKPEDLSEIKVYVVGAVNNPGVVVVKKGQIIQEAVNLAGGFRPDADIENINLVYELKTNVMLKIRSKNDPVNQTSNLVVNQPANANEAPVSSGVTVVSDSMGAVVNTKSGEIESKDGKGAMVNINTATKDGLMTLQGVGSSTADKIIKFREQNGPFGTIEDLKKVSGIGESKFKAVKDNITIN